MISYFSFFFVCHLLSDFVLQSNNTAKIKEQKIKCSKKRYKALGKHILYLLIMTAIVYGVQYKLFSPSLNFEVIIYSSLCIAFLHFFIDLIKPFINIFDQYDFKKLYIYLFDQLLHVFSIYIVLIFTLPRKIYLIFQLDQLNGYVASKETILFWIVSVFIIATFFGAYFIKLFLTAMELDPIEDSERSTTGSTGYPGIGRIIGLLERSLIIILVVADSYSGVATVIALKSIARFKSIEDNKEFAEYYLIGNLLSLTFSIIGGLIIKFLLFK